MLAFGAGIAAVCSASQVGHGWVARDERPWDEAFAGATSTNTHHDAERDVARLAELDRERTLKLLLAWLPKEQPAYLRRRATLGLGRLRYTAAIPAIETIVRDKTEPTKLRRLAMNIGLRYMKTPASFRIAKDFVKDKDLRGGAYWVLSGHGNKEAWELLRDALRTDREARGTLIHALNRSGDPGAGEFIFKTVSEKEVSANPQVGYAYVGVMRAHGVLAAAPVLAKLISLEHLGVKRAAGSFFLLYPHAVLRSDMSDTLRRNVAGVFRDRLPELRKKVAFLGSRLARFEEIKTAVERTPVDEEDAELLAEQKAELETAEREQYKGIASMRARHAELLAELDRITDVMRKAGLVKVDE